CLPPRRSSDLGRRWHYRVIAVAFGFIGDLLPALQTGPVGTARLGEGCQLIKSGWISHAIGSELTERGGCMNDFPDGSVIRGLEVNDIRGHRKANRRQDFRAIHDEHPLSTGRKIGEQWPRKRIKRECET